ncbi:MAG TPA: DUF1003 domain-containing protein [Tepidisphaeraceae bacterium]|jgi:uncharacterized membrane protein
MSVTVSHPDDAGAPNDPGMSRVVRRNIRALMEVRQADEKSLSRSDRVAAFISRFAGSMWFVYLHAIGFGGWLILNSSLVPNFPKWDPYPFVMLAMIASVEAIFLSTFILITQNRMQMLADRRAEMSLQVALLSEHEITRLIQILSDVARQLDVPLPSDVDDARRDVDPKKVAQEVKAAQERADSD